MQVLLFADDTVLVADNEDFKHNITVFQEAVKEHKLQINWGKTNTMVISRESLWSVTLRLKNTV